MTKSTRGRPPIYADGTRAVLHAKGRTKLQEGSERRAVINLLVSRSGVMTLGDINLHFGYDVRPTVIALAKSGWLDLTEAKP